MGSAKLSLSIKSNNFHNASKQLKSQCSRIQLACRKPWCSGGLLAFSLVIMTIMRVMMIKTMRMITSERILNLKVTLSDHTVLGYSSEYVYGHKGGDGELLLFCLSWSQFSQRGIEKHKVDVATYFTTRTMEGRISGSSEPQGWAELSPGTHMKRTLSHPSWAHCVGSRAGLEPRTPWSLTIVLKIPPWADIFLSAVNKGINKTIGSIFILLKKTNIFSSNNCLYFKQLICKLQCQVIKGALLGSAFCPLSLTW